MKNILIIIVFIVSQNLIFSDSLINNKDSLFSISAKAEFGFISVIKHTIQNGDSGTNFNYKEQGGQDILFPLARYELGLDISRSLIKFLYQPLEITTNVKFYEDVVIDDVTFVANTPMEVKYSFPFWRATYLYNCSPFKNTTIAGGLALQIRNASIVFKEIQGEQITVSQNVGPVPALSIYIDRQFNNGMNITFDATGSYASSSFINGADFDFEGSLLDTSLSVGFELKNDVEWFLTARFLGGSATGNSEYVERTWSESRSTYTDNQLATFILTTGIKIK